MSTRCNTPSPTRRLTFFYITALCTIALLALLGQIVIQSALQQESSDARVINIAGRQRMLSQRLSKAALALEVFPDTATRQKNRDELQAVIILWQRSQEGLEHGDAVLGLPGKNSETVKQLFARIEPYYKTMLHASQELLASVAPSQPSPTQSLLPPIQTILAAQSGFLVGMDHIVSQYQSEAEERVAHLKQTEFTLFGLTLLVLLLEGLFVFRPATRQLHQTIADLVQANERATRAEFTRKKAERILALNEALVASQQNTPHARIVALGHYQVRDNGSYYNVHYQEAEGQQTFICECSQYQQQKICSHSLAAAALHSVSGLQQY